MKYIKELMIDENNLNSILQSIIKNKIKVKSLFSYNDFIFIKYLDEIIEAKILENCISFITHHKSEITFQQIKKINQIVLDTNNEDLIINYAKNIYKERFKEAEEYIIKNLQDTYEYYTNAIYDDTIPFDKQKNNWEEGRKKILSNPVIAYDFIVNFVNQRVPEAEPAILQQLDLTLSYLHNIIGSKKRWIEAEKKYINNSEFVYKYSNLMEKRWLQGEKTLLKSKDENLVLYYIYLIEEKNNSWPEAKDVIFSSSQLTYIYSEYNNKQEDFIKSIIIKDPKSAAQYASNVINERWKEAESIISTDSEASIIYAQHIKNILGKIWRNGEKAILKDPRSAAKYSIEILEDRWKQGEKIISSDSITACIYANTFFKNIRWIDVKDIDPKIALNAEKNIMTNHKAIYQYCVSNIRGRWKEAESVLINDASSSIKYANYFLKKRWINVLGISIELAQKIEKNIIDNLYNGSPYNNFSAAINYIANVYPVIRWPELERKILEDKKNDKHRFNEIASMYARDVIKGIWLEAGITEPEFIEDDLEDEF